jgi:hypothetical protein
MTKKTLTPLWPLDALDELEKRGLNMDVNPDEFDVQLYREEDSNMTGILITPMRNGKSRIVDHTTLKAMQNAFA